MGLEPTYGKRLRKAAGEDFRNFWSGHRLWVTFSTLVAPFLIQILVHGWSSLLTLRETLESAALALGLSLIGNCLIAFYKGAKSLDVGLQDKIQQRDLTILADQQKEINERDPADAHHFRMAREIVLKLTEKDKRVLKHLWTKEKIIGRRGVPARIDEMGSDEVRSILAGLTATQIVSSQVDRDRNGPYETWEITPGYRKAFRELLFQPPSNSEISQT